MTDAEATHSPEEQRLRSETLRRRTFAIISHPDAGKTTLTEKLLLHGGAIHLAGSVKSRKAARHATSDWMELEKQRGISITSSVLNFDYRGYHLNLLDTPGHQDFSEDTYRTLAAADAAVMLIDSGKGVEEQTKKLFKVCRQREIPIFTFVNKMDRHGREPFELLQEVEDVLGIRTCPVTWPVGQGPDFKGVAELWTDLGPNARPRHDALAQHGAAIAALSPREQAKLHDDVGLLEVAGDAFDYQRIRRGDLSPAFFGSAWTEVGVDPFLDAFCQLAPSPGPRHAIDGRAIEPLDALFSGFVFKIQANMDPAHRDRLAFIRICSGRFQRGMDVLHVREERPLRLSMPHELFAQERVVIEEAYPGDVIGLFDKGNLRIGDTLCEGEPFEFAELPRFSPEIFARLRAKDAMKRKQLEKGLAQLSEEGAIQVFAQRGMGAKDPILGAVGALQLEVLSYRLEHEYGALTVIDRLPYTVARWVDGAGFDPSGFEHETDAMVVIDKDENAVALFKNEWNLNYAAGRHPDWKWMTTAPVKVAAAKKR
jgi:peptide chain release factor 3